MKVISILNQKGGVGKSSATVNLGVGLAKEGKKVLIIDLDPQGDTTDYSSIIEEQSLTTLEFLLNGDDSRMNLEHYDLIPSDISLSDFELRAVSALNRESILRKKMKALDFEEHYDYCLIDCPPSLGILSVNALTASNLVLSPILLERFSMKGLRSLNNTLQAILEINPGIQSKFLVNKFNKSYKHNLDNLATMHEIVGDRTLKSMIRQDVKLAQSQDETTNIFDYDSKSKAAADFILLAKEVIGIE